MNPQNITEVAVASDEIVLPLGRLARSYTYSGGLIATESVSYLGSTYTKTYTWTSGNLTAETGWVKV